MNALFALIQNFLGSLKGQEPTALQLALLRVCFVLIWLVIGVLAGAVIAFFVFLATGGTAANNAWPALISFFVVAASASLYGLYVAVFVMSNRNRIH